MSYTVGVGAGSVWVEDMACKGSIGWLTRYRCVACVKRTVRAVVDSQTCMRCNHCPRRLPLSGTQGRKCPMETLRLLKIQQPAQVERLLETFVSREKLLPKDCYRIRDPGALSSELRKLVARTTQEGRAWGCWADNLHTWVFTCEMSLPLSRVRGVPVLIVNSYDEAGDLAEGATWVVAWDGRWLRCAD